MVKRTTYAAGRGYTKADWDAVSDNPPLSEAEIAMAKPFAEMFPARAEAIKRGRGKQKAPTKKLVSIRLEQSTIEAFRATGPGWQSRIDEVLARAARKL